MRMRLLHTIIMMMLVAVSVQAQEEDDIAVTMDLPETVVLANGMTFEE